MAAALGHLDRAPSRALLLAEQGVRLLGGDAAARRVLGRAWLRNGKPDRALTELSPGASRRWPEDLDTLADLAVAAAVTHADITALGAYRRALTMGERDSEQNRILTLEYAVVLSRGSSRDRADAALILQSLLDQPMDPVLRAWTEGALALTVALDTDSGSAASLTPRSGQLLLRRVETDPSWAERLRAKVVGPDFGPRLARSERLAVVAILADFGNRRWADNLWAAVSAPSGSALSALCQKRLAARSRRCKGSRCP